MHITKHTKQKIFTFSALRTHYRMIAFILLALPLCCLFSCATPHKTKTKQSYSWHVKKRVFQKKTKHSSAQLDIFYPEISSTPRSAFSTTINQAVLTLVNKRIAAFSAKVPPNSTNLKDFPPEMHKDVLKIRYNTYFVTLGKSKILGLRFQIDRSFTGQMPFSTQYKVMNFDLTQEKVLMLESLFKADSNYLNQIAKYCLKKLPAQLALDMPWMPGNTYGLLPFPKNYRIWNLNNEGLMITFQHYQVEPYSTSAQTVVVPYSILRPMLREYI